MGNRRFVTLRHNPPWDSLTKSKANAKRCNVPKFGVDRCAIFRSQKLQWGCAGVKSRAPAFPLGVRASYHGYLGFYQEKNEVYHTVFAKSSCLAMVLQVKILDPTMRSSTQTCHEIPPPPMLTPINPPMTVITL